MMFLLKKLPLRDVLNTQSNHFTTYLGYPMPTDTELMDWFERIQ